MIYFYFTLENVSHAFTLNDFHSAEIYCMYAVNCPFKTEKKRVIFAGDILRHYVQKLLRITW